MRDGLLIRQKNNINIIDITNMATNSKERFKIIGEGFIIEKSGRKRKTYKCECLCGNIFEARQHSIKSGHTKSCGCLKKDIVSKIGKKTGPINCVKYAHGWNKGLYGINNPSYKGRTKLGTNIRNSDEYKEWRTKCFERDNYTCQISGQKGGDLVAHHLEPFSLLISDLNIDNYRSCELLWDINNGITITKELHNEFHKIYGKKNFTKESFLEYKNKQNEKFKRIQ